MVKEKSRNAGRRRYFSKTQSKRRLDASALAGTIICTIISCFLGYLGAVRRSLAYKDEDGRERITFLKYCQSSQEAADRSYTPLH